MKYFALFILIFAISSCSQEKVKQSDLDSLPKEWIKLTEYKNELVIYESCDMGNLLLSIINKGNNYKLLLLGTQEDSEFDILDVNQKEDTILIYTKSIDTKDNQVFKFLWVNKEKGIGRFITTYSETGFKSDLSFVSKEKRKKFKRIEQPCEECWGEECNEIKDTLIKK